MEAVTITKFLGTRQSGTATSSFVKAIATRDPQAHGVLVANAGASVTLIVHDNSSDTNGWYQIGPGSTVFVPFPPSSDIYIKGTTAYILQDVRVLP